MFNFYSYRKMCISAICPPNWLRLATSLQVRGSSRVKLGFGGAESFSIRQRNNNSNILQYQWNLRSISCCASPVHALRTTEILFPPFFLVKYQIRDYSAVRKGRIHDALEASYNLEEPLEKPSRLRRSGSKDSLEPSFLLEEPLGRPSISRKTRNKVGLTDLNKNSAVPSFPLVEPLEKPCNSRRTRSKVGQTDTKDSLQEPIGNTTKLKKTRRKLDVTDYNEEPFEASFHSNKPLDKPSKSRRTSRKSGIINTAKNSLDTAFPSVQPLEKTSKPRRTRRKVDQADPNKNSLDTTFPSVEPLKKTSKPRRTRRKVDQADPNKVDYDGASKGNPGKVGAGAMLQNQDGSVVFCQLEFDGASKGNGKAGAGAVLRNQDGSVICQLKEGLGRATCNVAEYRAIILGLKVALDNGIQRIHVQGDSMLVCMQIQDLWRTRCQNIAELCNEAKELKKKFKEFHIRHIYRKFNAAADALANAAVELQNGEIKKVAASLQLDNPHEKVSNSRREISKVDKVDSKKKLLEVSFPLQKSLEKPSKSGRTSCSGSLIHINKVFYRLEFDGASKGNPGKAGAGAVLRNPDGSVVYKLKEDVGIATNNVAEYRAVILGLKVALSKGIQRIHVQGDSKLVCMQVQDLWKVKSQNIAVLNMEAKNLISKFKEFSISHTYREFNTEANDLANAAIELQRGE